MRHCWHLLMMLAWLACFSIAQAAVTVVPDKGEELLDQVQARVAQVSVLRGVFAQEKKVEGFRNPLRSQGRFLVSHEHGILWITERPFPSELVVTREHIASRDPEGHLRIQVDARQQPGLSSINATLFALMGGDVAALAKHFELHPALLSDTQWQLVLVPKPGPLEQAFRQISLEGDRYVHQVRIDEGNGDQTLLHFSAFTDEPARLSAEEAAHFD